MPTASDRQNTARRLTYAGAGEAWTMVTELVAATAVWGAIGYGLDRWFGTWPILFAIGAVAGHATGIYMIILRAKHMSERARQQGVR